MPKHYANLIDGLRKAERGETEPWSVVFSRSRHLHSECHWLLRLYIACIHRPQVEGPAPIQKVVIDRSGRRSRVHA